MRCSSPVFATASKAKQEARSKERFGEALFSILNAFDPIRIYDKLGLCADGLLLLHFARNGGSRSG